MWRRIFNILAGLSLVIFVATIVLWALCPFYQESARLKCQNARHRNKWIFDANWVCLYGSTGVGIWLDKEALRPQISVGFGAGQWWKHGWYVTPLHPAEVSNLLPGFREFRRHEILWGDRQETTTGLSTVWAVYFQVPLWFLALASGILPAWRFGGWKRRRRRYRLTHRLCAKCGYDLAPPRRRRAGRCWSVALNAGLFRLPAQCPMTKHGYNSRNAPRAGDPPAWPAAAG